MTRTKTNEERKASPVFSGLLAYFPDACEAVANCSFEATQQHHPGSPMHWDRSKSGDEMNSGCRHIVDRAKGKKLDTDGVRHLAKAAWRMLAALQKEIEADEDQGIEAHGVEAEERPLPPQLESTAAKALRAEKPYNGEKTP